MSTNKRKRKAPRLTLTKKSRARLSVTVDPRDETPSDEEWRTQMVCAASFKHIDISTGSIVFVRLLDDVLLHSEDDDSNVWVGQIVSIRCRQNELADNLRRAWVRVRWYYSSRDIVGCHPSLISIASYFALNERALSDQYDILQFNRVQGPIHVYPWSESDLDPPEIGKDAIFIRGTLDTCHQQLSSPGLDGHACKICMKPYNPFPLSGPNKECIQHFCPRPNCRRWYHRDCLMTLYVENPQQYIGTRGIRLLAVDPDDQLPHPKFARYTYHRPIRGKMSSITEEDTNKPWEPLIDELTHGKSNKSDKGGIEAVGLGKDILKMAKQPIVRASDGTSFGIAGNVRDVVLARRFIYQFCEGWHDVVQSVEEKWVSLEPTTSSASLDDANAKSGTLQENLKDSLSTSRLLASPYASYWAKRAQKLQSCESTAPPLYCPGCGGAI